MHYTQQNLVEQKSLEIQGDQENKNRTNVFVASDFYLQISQQVQDFEKRTSAFWAQSFLRHVSHEISKNA